LKRFFKRIRGIGVLEMACTLDVVASGAYLFFLEIGDVLFVGVVVSLIF
jgi:hypothetical protein